MSKFDKVVQLWNESPEFRAAFKSDPEGTLSKRGISLSDEERAALKTVDFGASDEALQARANASAC